MNAPLRLERPQLLTDMALERIRMAIYDGQITLGEQVSEAQLRCSSASARRRCAKRCCG